MRTSILGHIKIDIKW
ncbi:Protein of unknown function [Lactobacillus helveticus CIRM-BIA 101]|nr:Protein of unknown function [Lactobacillus helveticus CIRM-BIA 101]